MQTTTESTTKLSAIDKALAAAKARAAARINLDDDAPKAKADKPSKEPKAKKETAPDAAKQQKKEALEAARAAAKAKRDAEREARRAAKTADAGSKKSAHMKKVEKAGSKLPQLNSAAEEHFNELTTNLSRAQVAALALHLQHFNRVKATEMAAGRSYKQGQPVRIVGGDPKFIGMQGTIDSARPLRCFVNVPGVRKPVYLFTSDIEPVEEAPLAATGTDG
jgi:hypothetical protein